MSDGERTTLALVTDIVRQMEAAYGSQDLFGAVDGRTVVVKHGVVLIDELESHLHPEWQREIGSWLKRAFPSVQFIVTTHSPIICQAADKDSLYHLQPGEEPEVLRIEGRDFIDTVSSRPNAIYRGPAFKMRQLRPSKEEARRQEYAQLRAKQAAVSLTAAEEVRLTELASLISDDYEEKVDA